MWTVVRGHPVPGEVKVVKPSRLQPFEVSRIPIHLQTEECFALPGCEQIPNIFSALPLVNYQLKESQLSLWLHDFFDSNVGDPGARAKATQGPDTCADAVDFGPCSEERNEKKFHCHPVLKESQGYVCSATFQTGQVSVLCSLVRI